MLKPKHQHGFGQGTALKAFTLEQLQAEHAILRCMEDVFWATDSRHWAHGRSFAPTGARCGVARHLAGKSTWPRA